MSLIIHAPNIHVGGGRTLLLSLLSSLDEPTVAQLDERFEPIDKLAKGVRIIRVAPRLLSRLRAERRLQKLCSKGDILLCFGNLPPLFRTSARVFVYVQNRYLIGPSNLSEFQWLVRLRIRFERLWLRFFLRDATPLVQTETMAQELFKYLGCEAKIIPFLPKSAPVNLRPSSAVYDYVYVASGEPHKNHRRLLEAWVLLYHRGLRPSLHLTLDVARDAELCALIERLKQQYELKISYENYPSDKIFDLYAQAKALIYPSLFESFGLPLFEAAKAGLPILASERDYVRDVVKPVASFDPESALSIARAVLRHQGLEVDPIMPEDPARFIARLKELE